MALELNQVGLNAGKIYNALKINPNLSANDLAKQLNIKHSDVYSALGWLARENKLNQKKRQDVYIPNSKAYHVFSLQD